MEIAKFYEEPMADMSDKPLFEGGKVYNQMQSLLGKTGDLLVGVVNFMPGGMTKMHIHDNEQLLYCIAGRGRVLNETEEHILTPGMIAYIAPGERHAHGAPEDGVFVQLSITKPCGAKEQFHF
jgi:quercetin dioxygenase-like cupin family protein